MIERPDEHIEEFAKAGADSISFHAEATPHTNRTLSAIRELGCLAGIALNPGTPAEAVTELRDYADILLCMTVNPGWGGQPFIPGSPDKVERLRERWSARPRSRSTAASTPPPRRESPTPGAGLFVAGSAVFGSPDPAEAYRATSPRPRAPPSPASRRIRFRNGWTR